MKWWLLKIINLLVGGVGVMDEKVWQGSRKTKVFYVSLRSDIDISIWVTFTAAYFATPVIGQ